VERGGVEPFGDIAGFVDAQEEEGYALRTGPLQCSHTVAGLFKRNAEARGESVNIVCHRLCFTQERLVRHQERRREIVGKLDVATRETCSRINFTAGGQLIE
jgi:hypothetical protein